MFDVKNLSISLRIEKLKLLNGYFTQQVAVRWQSNIFCKNKACCDGKTIGLLRPAQGTNARKANCSRVYFVYILKPVLSGRNL